MKRRTFLTGAVATLAWCSRGIPDFRWIPEITDSVQDRTDDLLNANDIANEAIEKTYRWNTVSDITLFKRLYCTWDCWNIEIYNALKDLQSRNGLEPDGILWPKTLELVYEEAMNSGRYLNTTQTQRYLIHTELQNYEEDRGRMPISVPNAFNNRKFFGGWDIHEFKNRPGTYITASLEWVLPQTWSPNTLYISRLWGKMVMRLYDQNGVLSIANYVSWWTNEHRSPEQRSYTTSWTHKYHISSEYPEEWDLWASMFNATNINGGAIWVHSSNDTIDGYDRSHGCYRAGLYYATGLYDYVNRVWSIRVEIWDLYA